MPQKQFCHSLHMMGSWPSTLWVLHVCRAASGSCWSTSHCQRLDGKSHTSSAPHHNKSPQEQKFAISLQLLLQVKIVWLKNGVCSLLQSRQCTDNLSGGYCETMLLWSQREKEKRCRTVLRSAVRALYTYRNSGDSRMVSGKENSAGQWEHRNDSW